VEGEVVAGMAGRVHGGEHPAPADVYLVAIAQHPDAVDIGGQEAAVEVVQKVAVHPGR